MNVVDNLMQENATLNMRFLQNFGVFKIESLSSALLRSLVKLIGFKYFKTVEECYYFTHFKVKLF